MKRFKKVYIEITNVCNLACSFCPRSDRASGFMSYDRFTSILDQIQPYTDYIYFHVKGEPLLHPSIGLFLDMCFEKGFKVNITTNGTRIGHVGQALITKPAVRQINFSLHSILDMGDAVSTMLGVTLESYLEEIFLFIRDARDKSEMIISLRLWNLSRDNDQITTPKCENRNETILSAIEKEFQLPYRINEVVIVDRGIKLSDQVYLNQDYEFRWPDITLTEENEKGFCYGLKDQIAILVDGTVVPCCLDGEGIVDLGNVFTENFANIIDSERAQNILRGFEKRQVVEELCRKCGYRTRFDTK